MTLDPQQLALRFGGRRIILGLGGGIAAYKMATVTSRLAQAGAEVTVCMTGAAAQFLTPLTFESLSGRPVYTSMWERIESHDPQHISLARAADAMLIAPATMDLIARLAHGFANDIVTLIASAINPGQRPILIAPSMNEIMWNQKSTQRNIAQLRGDGFGIIEPADGWQACRTVGTGRLPEPETLIEALADALGV